MRIIYMGTPEFATAPLRALLNEGFDIVAVITAPDKPAGRGRKIQQSAVKQFAEENLDCPILQPENLKDPLFSESLIAFNADLFIVVAFRMLPEVIWSVPRLGTFNLHASLLPQYRGAAPINHAIMNGENETGVTTFLIDQKIDTGRILFQEKVEIKSDDDAGSLHDKLMESGAKLVVHTANIINSGSIDPIDQNSFSLPDKQLQKAPKIFKDDCKIDWSKSINTVNNFIRGLSPFPTAFSVLQLTDKQPVTCKIFKGDVIKEKHELTPGTIKSDKKTYMHVALHDGFYNISSLQLAGKKRMSVGDFLRGFQDDIESCVFI